MSSQLMHIFEGSYSRSSFRFEKERLSRGFSFLLYDRWPTNQINVSNPPNAILSESYRGRSFEQIRVLDDCIVSINLDVVDNYVATQIAANSPEVTAQVMASITQEFPQRPKTKGLVPITFWANTPRGPRAYNREIAAHEWDEVSANYPSETRKVLDEILTTYEPAPEGGKLLLFSGPAGTGKTHFVRSLALSWQDKFDLHYVTDPDQFFGGGAEYLFDVLMGGDPEKWKLLVCEDTGELVSQDAKIQSGQALSRFLNLADGMIGQGLRLQILLTTNEEISRFHEAVVRPGRIAYNLVFPKFSPAEASTWLGIPVERDMTLAEMYATKRGESIPAPRRAGII